MKNKAMMIRLIVILAALVLAVSVSHITVIPDPVVETVIDEATGEEVAVEQLTVAQQYCADNWDEKMLPAIEEKAQPVETIVEAVKANLDDAGATYGQRENETSAWNFAVKGSAKVVGIENAEKASKTRLLLDVAPYDGEADCKLQVSSVIKTNAIRDVVGFLKLDDFANQVEFAELTRAFNDRIKETVLADFDAAASEGKTIDFIGAVALTKMETADDMLIIPVSLSVAE